MDLQNQSKKPYDKQLNINLKHSVFSEKTQTLALPYRGIDLAYCKVSVYDFPVKTFLLVNKKF